MSGEGVVAQIITWLTTHGIELGKDIIVSLVIMIVAKISISMVIKGIHSVLERSGKVTPILQKFTESTVSKALWILVFVIIISQFGIDIGPLIAGLGVTGFILGFAFQETIGNLLAGVMISLNNPFGIDDYVDIGGVAGSVKAMDMISTTLHTPDNKKVVMANKNVWGTPITNFTTLGTRRVDMIFGVSYGTDIGFAKEIITKELEAVEQIMEEPAPLIEVFSMSESSVDFAVRPWVKTKDYWKVYYTLNQRVKYAFDENGIEIPFPQIDVHHHGYQGAAQ